MAQQRRTEREMASMRTLAHAMNSVQAQPGVSGPLPAADGGSTALNGAQGPLADLEVEVFKDMVRHCARLHGTNMARTWLKRARA